LYLLLVDDDDFMEESFTEAVNFCNKSTNDGINTNINSTFIELISDTHISDSGVLPSLVADCDDNGSENDGAAL